MENAKKEETCNKKHEVLKDSTLSKEKTTTEDDQNNHKHEQAKSGEKQHDSGKIHKSDVEQMKNRTGAERPKAKHYDNQAQD